MRTFLCGLMGLMLLPAVIWADDFAKFRIPTHTVHSLSGTGIGTWDNYYDSNDNNGLLDRMSDKQGDIHGSFSLNGVWLKESEQFRLRTMLDLSAASSKLTAKMRQSNASYHSTDNNKTTYLSERGAASAEGTYYPFMPPIGVRGYLSGNANYQQRWNNEVRLSTADIETRRDDDQSTWDYGYNARVDLSLGWGRVRDVSAVYDVYLFDQRLLQCGALTRPLTDESKQKLIDLMYIRSDYKYSHDRPNRFFWQEIQKILEQDGGLKANGLDANALYRIAEPYLEYLASDGQGYRYTIVMANFYRERGYFVGFDVKETHGHSIERMTSNSTQIYTSNDSTWSTLSHTYSHRDGSADQFSIGLKAEGHLPVGMRWQLDGDVEAFLPQHNAPKAMELTSDVSATYFIADRWLGQLSMHQSRSIERQSSYGLPHYYDDSWDIMVGASVHYFIEDNLSVSLSWGHSQYRDQYGHESSLTGYDSATYRRDNSVFLGFTYSILGKLNAPGIASSSKLPRQAKPAK